MDILETDAYDRRRRRNMSCALLLSLSPFFFTSAVYFYTWTPASPPSILLAGVKSAPTLLLAAAVLSWKGGQSLVAVGLVFSAVGDFCLVWQEFFLHGMAAFAVAHLLYSLTFLSARYQTYSSSSCASLLYLILVLSGGAFFIYLHPFLQKEPNSDVLIPAVGVYVVLITLMGILAMRTRRAFPLLGGLFFIASDIALALQVFKVVAPVAHGQTVVMVTYYLAQLLISVGDVRTVERKNGFGKRKRT